MSKSPSLRRIQADVRELALDPSDRYYAAPLDNDMFEWHFTIRGADGTDFEGGIYHGRILVRIELLCGRLIRCHIVETKC
jgi:ubiquitin-conjugating enzyme E2 J1